jgi:hypothetical protein
MSDGKKFDGGKPPVGAGLVRYFPRALCEAAEQSRYGKEKYDLTYADKNWQRVEDAEERYEDALLRHLVMRHVEGPIDLQSGEAKRRHLAAVAWNALALLELELCSEEEQQAGDLLRNRVGVVLEYEGAKPPPVDEWVKGYSWWTSNIRHLQKERNQPFMNVYWVRRSDVHSESTNYYYLKKGVNPRAEDPNA